MTHLTPEHAALVALLKQALDALNSSLDYRAHEPSEWKAGVALRQAIAAIAALAGASPGAGEAQPLCHFTEITGMRCDHCELEPDPIDPTIGPELGLGHSGRFIPARVSSAPSEPADTREAKRQERLRIMDRVEDAIAPREAHRDGTCSLKPCAAFVEASIPEYCRTCGWSLESHQPTAQPADGIDVEALARETAERILVDLDVACDIDSAGGRTATGFILAAFRRLSPAASPGQEKP